MARPESGLTKTRIIADLTRSPHGALKDYVAVGEVAVKQDEDFYAHLIAWAQDHSEIRDCRVALPVIALKGASSRVPFGDNAVAHMAQLDPRLFFKAVEFARDIHAPTKLVARLVGRYLKELEQADGRKWEHVVLQHRGVLKALYTKFHVNPNALSKAVIVEGRAPEGTVFAILRKLSLMDPMEAAGAIIARRIPFLIAAGALGAKMKSPEVVLALIQQMSPTELVTNAKRLQKLGVNDHPALKAAMAEALEKAASGKKRTATLKATTAAEAVDDPVLKAKLKDLQEKQLTKYGIDGNWLVLADKSGSMSSAIAAAREVAAILTRTVKGTVHLVFFDSTPRAFDVTGHTLEAITALTRTIRADGNTSVGCGLQWALDRGLSVDGIAIVTDGGENTAPAFAAVYGRYVDQIRGGVAIPVYLYLTAGDRNALSLSCKRADLDVQEFDLSGGIDKYSLPSVVQTMRTQRYGLTDEILETPLLTLDTVLPKTTSMAVFPKMQTTRV